MVTKELTVYHLTGNSNEFLLSSKGIVDQYGAFVDLKIIECIHHNQKRYFVFYKNQYLIREETLKDIEIIQRTLEVKPITFHVSQVKSSSNFINYNPGDSFEYLSEDNKLFKSFNFEGIDLQFQLEDKEARVLLNLNHCYLDDNIYDISDTYSIKETEYDHDPRISEFLKKAQEKSKKTQKILLPLIVFGGGLMIVVIYYLIKAFVQLFTL